MCLVNCWSLWLVKDWSKIDNLDIVETLKLTDLGRTYACDNVSSMHVGSMLRPR